MSNPSKTLIPGTPLCNGKYIVEHVIGSGGFGITYQARHAMMDHVFAIKEFFISGKCVRNTQHNTVLIQDITADIFNKYKRRFVDEARLLANLDHKGIVRVIDVFEENGTAYYAMPFVQGQTLQKKVETLGPLSIGDTINYIAQLTESVAYIHKNHILHRDLKPDNIIITPNHCTMLIDFGSARQFINDEVQHHTAILTQGYAPPEQYSATSKKGNYTDIYALGGILYFCLTGRTPLDGMTRSIEPLPEPISINPSIPPHINHAIMKALELQPANRHQTVEEFRNDILGNVEESPSFDIDREAQQRQLEERQRQNEERMRIEQEKMRAESAAREAELREEKDWLDAKKSNSVVSWKNFIQHYPSSKHLNEAQKHLLICSENETLSNCRTIEGYQAFMQAFPNSSHIDFAKRKIEELEKVRIIEDNKAWESYLQSKSTEKLKKYIATYPNGIHAQEAKNVLKGKARKKTIIILSGLAFLLIAAVIAYLLWPTEGKAWKKAQKENTFESYSTYLDSYPIVGGDPVINEHIREARHNLFIQAGDDIEQLQSVSLKCTNCREDTIATNKIASLLCSTANAQLQQLEQIYSNYTPTVNTFNDLWQRLSRLEKSNKIRPERIDEIQQTKEQMSSAIEKKCLNELDALRCDDASIIRDAEKNLSELKQAKMIPSQTQEIIDNTLNK